MNILITGTAGFIGFSVAKELLDKNHQIYGIDNLDNYYSVKLKKKRLEELKKYKNFIFYDIDITNKKNIKKISKLKIKLLYHFAAQPGVRYSLVNPKKYYDTNVKGFENILDIINKKQLTKVIYASSSSVYGDQTKFPTKEDSPLNAKNPYGVSKMMNENLASIYSNIYNLNFVGLRLFTVYGEWGRPDMFTFKLLNCIKKNKIFYLNKSGNHKRDLTYIKDVINICTKLINYKADKKNEIFNICSSRSTNIKNLKEIFLKKYPNAKIVNAPANKADVKDTFGSNQKIKKAINYRKFTKFEIGIKNSIAWFENNKIEKLIQ
jgi:UDP-glucuronate 4-epimerase